ncbi:MAG: phosphoenolpyruvate synthase [Candidatus Levybacteria bacterium]|nr:phosphoenolpyruvate synthase [Candidatus Levybacteria bacterium]
MTEEQRFIYWFSEIDKNDIPIVGGKGANLGEMTKASFPVPDGFIVSAQAYFSFLRENNLTTKIKHLLNTVNIEHQESLRQVSEHVKKIIMHGDMSEELTSEIFKSYRTLGGVVKDALVAVRSSATAEDLPTASFAGQQETYLNVQGEANLLQKIKAAWASLFEARAIFYREEKKFNHFKVGIAIVVQKMVASEKSGVMFTIDPVTNEKSKIIIEAIYGLGEMIVQGQVNPDHYDVAKKDDTINRKIIADQRVMLKKVGTQNKQVSIPPSQAKKQKITDSQIKALAQLGKKLEKHYYFPQDVEWAIVKDTIYLVQTRPITTIPKNQKPEEKVQMQKLPLLLQGSPASPGIASGPVKIITKVSEIDKILQGDVMVTPQTNPDFVPAMKKASAIVTEKGGRTSHAAIVSRELGIPAVVGADNATKILKHGMVVTVNGIKGEVYKGGQFIATTAASQERERIQTATKVYVNLAQPEIADRVAQKHVDGVGLLRAEFMMANIGTHPKKFLRDGKKQVFIDKLVDQLTMFCQAFNPRPVVYRTTDFKSNEYRGLIGGKEFEPIEANPMLGYRGAYRYISDPEVFNLELEAIKIIRNKKNFKNLWVMLPFVRTVKELIDVKKLIAKSGLYRSPTFKLWMMVEIPSNVILLEKFIEAGIDGVSIGSNDLTMLILGTDRDNNEVAHVFDEQNDAVLWAFEHVIKTCNKYKITSSMCGQAPSQYPSLVEKLVRLGITSVSVSPDTIEDVRKTVALYEKKLR